MAKVKEILLKFKSSLEGGEDIEKFLSDLDKGEEKAKKKFDEINNKIKESSKSIDKLKEREQLLLNVRNRSQSTEQIKKYNRELQDTQKRIKDIESTGIKSFGNLNNSILKIGGALGIAFGISQVVAFGKAAFSAFQEAEKSSRLLEIAVKK